MQPQATLTSPRLLALQRELESGNRAALDMLWRDVTKCGTPLIEPIAGDPERVLATFLWRDDGATENVVLLSVLDDVVFEDSCWDFARCRFMRLTGSDVFYRMYRLPSDARFTYQLSPNDTLVPCAEVADWPARRATWQVDPLNPNRYVTYAEENPDTVASVVSVVELPAAPPQPWITPRPATRAGQLRRSHVRSKTLGNQRKAWVYTPPGYTSTGEPYGFVLILGDWASYISAIPTPTILDNLLAEGRIPPLVAIVIDITGDRFRELTCNPAFNMFLVQELLPWARQKVHITTDPRQAIIVGCSLGGAAATFAGLSHPEVFGNVLAQDGAFWVYPGYDPVAAWEGSLNESTEPEWLAEQLAVRDRVPLRLYLETGRYTGTARPFFPGNLAANRHMRNVLRAKGYDVTYSEYSGGHEFVCWRGSFADGLIALIDRAP
jgi:enterochelin esterase-like enzyme